MESPEAIDLGRQAIMLAFALALPLLSACLVVGLLVSLLQAVTQVYEPTLSFAPKVLAVVVVCVVMGPWILRRLVDFSAGMFLQ